MAVEDERSGCGQQEDGSINIALLPDPGGGEDRILADDTARERGEKGEVGENYDAGDGKRTGDGRRQKEEEELVARLETQHEDGEGDECKDGEGDEHFPDGGWGWVVAAGCYIIAALVNTIGPCFGILFSRFLLDLGTSSTMIAWVFNIRAFILCLSQMLLGPLVAELGWRRVAFLAGCLVAVGLGISAFATSAVFLIFSYSLLTGVGSGLNVGILFSIIPHYFKRRRGRANAIMHLGISTGQMAGPLLISYLQDYYGFRGSTLVLSAIVFNCCIGAAVFHPVEWHSKAAKKRAARLKKDDLAHRREAGMLPLLLRIFRNMAANMRLLRSPQVFIIALGSSMNTTGFLNFLMIVPFALQADGYTLEESAWCVSVAGLCNLLTRISVSSITDLPRVSKRVCYMTGTAMALFSIIAFSQLEALMWRTVAMAVWGSGVGAFMSLHSLIMVQYVGLDRLVPTLGVCGVFNGLTFIFIGPLVGVMRDLTQSYTATMWTLAALFAVTFTLWLLMPAALAWDRRKAQKTRSDSA